MYMEKINFLEAGFKIKNVVLLGKPTRKKSTVFFNIVQKAFDPPPFYLNICPILQGVFFKTRFSALKMWVKIWYNVPISPPNFTKNP